MTPSISDTARPSSDSLAAVLAEAKRRFGQLPEYRGADRGFRWTNGKPTDEVTVRIHVARKLPEKALSPGQILPKEIDGVRLDVIEGDYRAMRQTGSVADDNIFEPHYILGGTSCGRMSGGLGTAGIVVMDREGRPGILSNWHVLAGMTAKRGDPIITPDRPGALKRGNRIGWLSQWMLDRHGDAAIATLDSAIQWLPIQDRSFLQAKELRQARLGEILTKTGQASGVTRARVDGIGSYRLSYETSPGVWTDHHIEAVKLVSPGPGGSEALEASSAGDSGAVWIHAASNAAIGLHCASDASATGEHALACHLEAVLDQFEARLAGFDDFLAAGGTTGQQDLGAQAQGARTRGPEPAADLFAMLSQAAMPAKHDMVEIDHGTLGMQTDAPEREKHRQRIDAIWQKLRAALESAGIASYDAPLTSRFADLIDSPRASQELTGLINHHLHRFGLSRKIKEDEILNFKTFYDLCWLLDAIARGDIE
ncbi:MAG: hypothetical protein OIF40_11915 [Mangrovicoccus sp.]|nr:hypothetical protein [Mangrovicoccus sp.]